jgi:hypothetical protein
LLAPSARWDDVAPPFPQGHDLDTTHRRGPARFARSTRIRSSAASEAALRNARIPEKWSLATFPFDRQPGVDARVIRQLGRLELVDRAENLVLSASPASAKQESPPVYSCARSRAATARVALIRRLTPAALPEPDPGS